ncbi:hypothetical protein TNCV_2810671 [Trichonephila clavipes]|nr:hypothetical protein TNCV_2810671 [Trichonephila clavipes]
MVIYQKCLSDAGVSVSLKTNKTRLADQSSLYSKPWRNKSYFSVDQDQCVVRSRVFRGGLSCSGEKFTPTGT